MDITNISLKTIMEIMICLFVVIYGFLIILDAIRLGLRDQKGSFIGQGLVEAFVSFCASMGFSDFVLCISFWKKFDWMDDKTIPPTLFAACIVPDSILGFYFIRTAESVNAGMLALIVAVCCTGTYIGSHFVQKLDGNIIKKVMRIALILSIGALIIKLIVSNGEPGTLTSLSTGKMLICLPIVFGLGFVNTFGVPVKPATAPLFLLLGLSPITTLTLVLSLGVFGPASACIKIFKNKTYHRKIALAGMTFGAIGALLGCLFTITLKPIVLTILFIVMIIIAIISLGKQKS